MDGWLEGLIDGWSNWPMEEWTDCEVLKGLSISSSAFLFLLLHGGGCEADESVEASHLLVR